MPEDLSINGARKFIKNERQYAEQLIRSIPEQDWANDNWIVILIIHAMKTYDSNLRADYFHSKYPGYPEDVIANKLINGYTTYAGMSGLVAGGIATGLPGFGTIPAILTDIMVISRLQILLVLDLANAYRIPLDPNNPDDLNKIIVGAFGAKALDAVKTGVVNTSMNQAPRLVEKVMSNGRTWPIKRILKNLTGRWIPKGTVIAKSVPFAAILVGTTFNATSIRMMGHTTKHYLKPKKHLTATVMQAVPQGIEIPFIIPVALRYLAEIDGDYARSEFAIYDVFVKRVNVTPHQREDYDHLLANRELLMQQIDEQTDCIDLLLEMLLIMTAADGNVHRKERELMEKIHTLKEREIDEDKLAAYVSMAQSDLET